MALAASTFMVVSTQFVNFQNYAKGDLVAVDRRRISLVMLEPAAPAATIVSQLEALGAIVAEAECEKKLDDGRVSSRRWARASREVRLPSRASAQATAPPRGPRTRRQNRAPANAKASPVDEVADNRFTDRTAGVSFGSISEPLQSDPDAQRRNACQPPFIVFSSRVLVSSRGMNRIRPTLYRTD